jgi:ADP-ribose pyrophosphatase
VADTSGQEEESWEVLESEVVLEHPFLGVAMQKVRLPDGRVIPDWPIVRTRDYVNVTVVNERGEFLILEGYKHGLGRSSWQVPGGYLEEGEAPLDAAKRELLEETGYVSSQWRALGSYVVDANRRVGMGHFFMALGARLSQNPTNPDLESCTVHWFPADEVEAALGDGRVGVISYAVNLALALLAAKAASIGGSHA